MMLAWVIALFLGGVALIVAEFFVPGGILGILGGVLLIISTALGWYEWPDYGMYIALGEAFGALVLIIVGLIIIRQTGANRVMMLMDTQDVSEGYVSDESKSELVGCEGEAYTMLRPAGTVIIDDERYGAVADGAFIPKGATVRVVEVHGNRVVVEQVRQEAPAGQ
jgi:membrane-bound serine protease (ClpP class)